MHVHTLKSDMYLQIFLNLLMSTGVRVSSFTSFMTASTNRVSSSYSIMLPESDYIGFLALRGKEKKTERVPAYVMGVLKVFSVFFVLPAVRVHKISNQKAPDQVVCSYSRLHPMEDLPAYFSLYGNFTVS